MKTLKKLTVTSLLLVCFAYLGNAQEQKQEQQKQAPKATYQSGKALVTVWENKKEGRYGEYTEKNFRVEKMYKKGDKWEFTNYFNMTELLQLQAAINKAINEEAVKIKAKEGTKEKWKAIGN